MDTSLFWTAVHWLIAQTLFCCLYWLLSLSIRALGRTLPQSLCKLLLSGRVAEALLRIGHRERPVILPIGPPVRA